jgi:hypothetical protein
MNRLEKTLKAPSQDPQKTLKEPRFITSQPITLRATFPSYQHFLGQSPSKVEAEYLDGTKLNAKDAAKVDRILEYYLHSNIYPCFVLLDDEMRPLIGELELDLMKWTNENTCPRFKIKPLIKV